VYISRTDKKVQRRQGPLKLVFLYTFALVLVLVIAALVSLFIGYTQAAFMMAVGINAGLAGWVGYLVLHYFKRKRKKLALA
jgi:membrane associated rhomboid family serine protease